MGPTLQPVWTDHPKLQLQRQRRPGHDHAAGHGKLPVRGGGTRLLQQHHDRFRQLRLPSDQPSDQCAHVRHGGDEPDNGARDSPLLYVRSWSDDSRALQCPRRLHRKLDPFPRRQRGGQRPQLQRLQLLHGLDAPADAGGLCPDGQPAGRSDRGLLFQDVQPRRRASDRLQHACHQHGDIHRGVPVLQVRWRGRRQAVFRRAWRPVRWRTDAERPDEIPARHDAAQSVDPERPRHLHLARHGNLFPVGRRLFQRRPDLHPVLGFRLLVQSRQGPRRALRDEHIARPHRLVRHPHAIIGHPVRPGHHGELDPPEHRRRAHGKLLHGPRHHPQHRQQPDPRQLHCSLRPEPAGQRPYRSSRAALTATGSQPSRRHQCRRPARGHGHDRHAEQRPRTERHGHRRSQQRVLLRLHQFHRALSRSPSLRDFGVALQRLGAGHAGHRHVGHDQHRQPFHQQFMVGPRHPPQPLDRPDAVHVERRL